MAASTVTTSSNSVNPRGGPPQRTLRTDRYWVQPAITALVLLLFVIYSTWRAFEAAHYSTGAQHRNYVSPFYSPCLASSCPSDVRWVGLPFGSWLSPALYILIIPLGLRLTCYYYRKAYYRAFWLSPPACAVAEPHKSYTGETRFPLILQNIHRYFLYFALAFNVILTWDAIVAFRDHSGAWGHMGLGTVILLLNATLLWGYSLGCHSCRHVVGGRLNKFSTAKFRYRLWKYSNWFNQNHMKWAWASLVVVGLTDLYVRLVASGAITDPRFF